MKPKNLETLIREKENLRDLPEDIMERTQDFREEMLTGLESIHEIMHSADIFKRNNV